MFRFYNFRHHFYRNKLIYISVIMIFTAGFISGGIYSNFLTQNDYLMSRDSFDKMIKSTSAFRYGFSDEITVFGIFAGSFFVFGRVVISFFIFRFGFMAGYLCAFIIKTYSVSSLWAVLTYIFINIIFLLPAISAFGVFSYNVCRSVTDSVFKGHTACHDIKKLISSYIIFFIICLIFVSIFSHIKYNLFMEILHKIF